MAIQIQLRRGTSTEWAAANTILAEAEIAVELDTFQFKIGDGITHWSDLPYGGIHGPMAGSNTYIIYNYNGYANGSPAFTFDYSTNTLNLSNNLIVGNNISTANLFSLNAHIDDILSVSNTINSTHLNVYDNINVNDLNVNNNLFVSNNLIVNVNLDVYDTLNVNNNLNVINTLSTNNSIVNSTLDVYDTLNVNNNLNVTNTLFVSNTISISNIATLGNNFILGANLNNGGIEQVGPALVLGTDASILTNGPDNTPWYAPQGGSFATEQKLFFANASLIQVGNSSSYFNLYNDSLSFYDIDGNKAGSISVSSLVVDAIEAGTLVLNGISSGTVGSDSITANTISVTTSISVGDETTSISINSTSFSGTSNNTLYVGDVYYDNVVSNSQLSANLANYSNTYLMLANDDTTYSNAVYYTDTIIGLVNTAITSNAATTYANAVYYTDTVIGLVNTAITSNSATTYSNSVYYTDTVIGLVNTAITSNATTTYANSVNYTDTVIGLVNTAITSNAATTYSNSVYYTDTVIGLVNTAITSNAATTYSNATTFSSNATNITNGTLGENRLPYRMNQNVRTTDNVTFNTITTTDNVSIASNKSLIINANTSIDFDTTTYKPDFQKGRMYWDNEEQTIVVYGDGSSFEQTMGQREWVRCRNSTASTIAKGTPVYITGVHIPGNPVHGHHPTIAPGDASDYTKSQIVGLTGEDITSGSHGYVVVRGYIEGIDTSALTSGQRAHLGFQTPGTIVQTAPEYPNFPTDLGMCLTADATNGTFYVDLAMHTAERFRTTQDMYIGGDLTVFGNVNVTGNVFTTSATNLSVADNLIYLGGGDTITTSFNNAGLNDMLFHGVYEGNTVTTYYVRITSASGSADKFSWSKDNFVTTVAANVTITTASYSLDNGISIQFNAVKGHTLGDTWYGTGSPINVDLGWVGNYNDGVYHHTGIFRDASDGVYKFFQNYTPEPDAEVNINTGHASFQFASVQANTFTGNLVGTATNSSKLGNIDAAGYQTLTGLAANVILITSNNATYAFGKPEANLNVNSAITANNSLYLNSKPEANLNVNSAISSNNATYAFGKNENALNVNSAITANNSTYAFNKTEVSLNVNSAISSNNSTYAFGKTEISLNVNNALIANNSTYLNSKPEANLNVNSAITANNSTYLNSKLEANLNVNNALTANNSSYLGGVISTYYVNTSSSYTITGVHTYNANVVFGTTSGISANGGYGTSGQVLTSNGTSVYWSTIYGTNVASQYAWTNTQSFSNTITFTGSILANTINAASHTVGTTFIANTTQLTISGIPVSANGGVGTAGQVLTSNGATGSPYWSTVTSGSGGGGFSNGQSISVANLAVTGSLTANGGVGTAGQVLTSNGSSVYWSTSSSSSLTAVRQQFVGDGTTTSFSVAGGYTANAISVFLNGVLLRNGTEVTVTSGTSIVFAAAPPSGSLIDVIGTVPTTYSSITPVSYSTSFSGATGQYLSLAGNAAFNFGTSDFTIECWAYFNDFSDYRTLIGNYTSTSSGGGNWLFQHIISTNKMGFYYDGGGSVITGTTTLTTGTWYHFAMVRSGTTVTAYVNGLSQGTATFSGTVGSSTASLNIGAPQNISTARMNGYISNVRITKGVAVYTGAFTPPQTPLAAVQSAVSPSIQAISGTQTSLLTCNGPTIIDGSTNAFTITNNGTAPVSTSIVPTFTNVTINNPSLSTYQAAYLVVAGGGGGGAGPGGGGGAGGLLTSSTLLSTGTTYTITVGAGGAASPGTWPQNVSANGVSGSNSSIGAIAIAIGGGGGAGGNVNGLTGGSGGGSAGIGGAGGAATSGQGYAGGLGQSTAGDGAGGGGAGGAGSATQTTGYAGNGGAGFASSMSGTSVYYAGGGGGGGNSGGSPAGSSNHGTGGSGGGGDGGWSSSLAAVAGTANLGGGGGGGGRVSGTTNYSGASGGSGVVIISIPTTNYTGITTGSPTVNTITSFNGSYKILTFTSSGSYTA